MGPVKDVFIQEILGLFVFPDTDCRRLAGEFMEFLSASGKIGTETEVLMGKLMVEKQGLKAAAGTTA